MFKSIIELGNLNVIPVLICIIGALLLGIIIARVYMFCGTYSKNFVMTLVILPTLVGVVVLMVNGSIGAGVAILGAFSLVRFRSIPGSSREISSLFFAMAVGLAAGMGYIGLSVIVTAILCVAMMVMRLLHFGEKNEKRQELRITIPENLDYTEIFDDIFDKYLNYVAIEKVKTTNLGSMYEITYLVEPKKETNPKMMMDEMRCRNGNLPIIFSRQQIAKDQL